MGLRTDCLGTGWAGLEGASLVPGRDFLSLGGRGVYALRAKQLLS